MWTHKPVFIKEDAVRTRRTNSSLEQADKEEIKQGDIIFQ